MVVVLLCLVVVGCRWCCRCFQVVAAVSAVAVAVVFVVVLLRSHVVFLFFVVLAQRRHSGRRGEGAKRKTIRPSLPDCSADGVEAKK